MTAPLTIPCETIMQSIADGVFTVDLQWNITFFNSAAESITGIRAQEAVGRKCWEVLRSSLCDGQCALDACMHRNVNVSGKSIFIVRSDGTRVPISISAAPLRDPQGELIGGVETFRDLSEVTLLRKEMQSQYGIEDIVGKSPALSRIFAILPPVARSGSSVLLTGESGTGKELFARALHNHSERAQQPFIAVNCAALPPALLESELFGYKKGAFTDARKDKPGRLALAHGGTLFLDEIGDMPLPLQAKLLRVLQEKKFDPLGGIAPEEADVRIIAATNSNMEQLVEQGGFRRDLYFRLNVVRMELPALRERRSDIPLLAAHFVQRFNTLQNKQVQGLSEDVLATLMRHEFSGNVRELENIIEYAFILCSSGFIQMEHLPDYLQHGTAASGGIGPDSAAHPAPRTPGTTSSLPPAASAPDSVNGAHRHAAFPPSVPQEALTPQNAADRTMTMRDIKKQAVLQALARHGGRRMAACRDLDISKDTLRRILNQPDKA
ncbi:sigma-54 interaction domain-containing protein [Oleidesulfovibrio alaskensis]|uniref:sigma-54 interaction domain-containing protein n=1 Tax=Oleidesulfovibrio alaskensis TaxID=58180 RepID=UPI000419D5F2|nr:sigma 54-interacting transcriptional regulator [Oleidesulfovibrio alaskensis]